MEESKCREKAKLGHLDGMSKLAERALLCFVWRNVIECARKGTMQKTLVEKGSADILWSPHSHLNKEKGKWARTLPSFSDKLEGIERKLPYLPFHKVLISCNLAVSTIFQIIKCRNIPSTTIIPLLLGVLL
ncbi:hypothetical protein D5086_010620 [Populus alba]|uniref:Uncharacterized protein n=1 Tax=Populus alba TaxID=43335 RepID=A0ACC4CAI5_POPAL